MANPDYLAIADQIKDTAVGSDERAALVTQLYVFEEPLTDAEEDIFGFISRDYFDDNPGDDDAGNFVSYIGVYYNQAGANTG